jgi:hypothetical protein
MPGLDVDSRRAAPGRLVPFALACLAALSLFLTSCSSRPVEMTVTTDASRSSALPPGAEPLAISPNLPARDENIEAAGDRIAEAITYLNTRQRDRRERALRALVQAEVVMNRALRARPRGSELRTALHAALKDLDSAQRSLQHSAPDAVTLKQLAALNKSLDSLEVNPAPEPTPPDPNSDGEPAPQP